MSEIPSEKLIAQLMRHEGFYSKPYLCPAQVCTIGYGTNLEAHPQYIPFPEIQKKVAAHSTKGEALCDALKNKGMVWTKEQAKKAMLEEVLACHGQLETRCAQYVKLRASGQDVRADVLLNMAFNMGISGLLTFKNTLAMIDKALTGAGTWNAVHAGMLNSRWATQVKRRANELALQMAGGVYQ